MEVVVVSGEQRVSSGSSTYHRRSARTTSTQDTNYATSVSATSSADSVRQDSPMTLSSAAPVSRPKSSLLSIQEEVSLNLPSTASSASSSSPSAGQDVAGCKDDAVVPHAADAAAPRSDLAPLSSSDDSLSPGLAVDDRPVPPAHVLTARFDAAASQPPKRKKSHRRRDSVVEAEDVANVLAAAAAIDQSGGPPVSDFSHGAPAVMQRSRSFKPASHKLAGSIQQLAPPHSVEAAVDVSPAEDPSSSTAQGGVSPHLRPRSGSDPSHN